MPDGIVIGRPEDMIYQKADIYGTVLQRSPLFEGDYDVRSAFFKLEKGGVIKMHRHEKWVQVAVLGGAVHVAQHPTSFTVRAGEVYFLEPGHPHEETALEDSLLLVTQGEDRPGWSED